MKTVVSFSGGRTSAYMAFRMINERSDLDLAFVFANTGMEREETLVFIDRCAKHFGVEIVWIEAVINPQKGIGPRYKAVDFETADRNGAPFYGMVAKFGIPNKDSPHCTRELKDRIIERLSKQLELEKQTSDQMLTDKFTLESDLREKSKIAEVVINDDSLKSLVAYKSKAEDNPEYQAKYVDVLKSMLEAATGISLDDLTATSRKAEKSMM